MRDYGWSCLVSAGMVLLLLLVNIAGSDSAAVFLAPGMFVALLLFPQGVHGDLPYGYLAFAMIIDVLLCGWVVFGVWRLVRWVRAGR